MNLRGIHIENWGCIGQLTLTDLPCGVIVLHGPNQTGKSSLVRAIRSCLFDHDHDTTKEEVRAAVPWNTDHSPHVAIEFETAGKLYRLTKQFSKRKDGFARLERRDGSTWIIEVADPKEASRRARELLGCEDSEAGLNQLLWLHQGEVSLPKEKSLDASLVKRLNAVLGTLVTSRDLDIKQAIDKGCERWFTASGEHKKGKKPSPVIALELALEERRKLLADEDERFRSLELVISDIERCEDELPGLEAAARAAQDQLQLVSTERDATRERRQQFGLLQKALQQAEGQERRMAERVTKLQEARKRWEERETEVVRAEAAASVSEEQRDALARQAAQASQALAEARQAEDRHLKGFQAIADRKEWLRLEQQREMLKGLLSEADQLAHEIAQLELKIKETRAPEAKLVQELRRNREESLQLRARLQAEVLSLTLIAEQNASVSLSIDGTPPEDVPLSSAEVRSWHVRQRASLQILQWGKVELARGQSDEDLERAAERLNSLDSDYASTVRRLGENPSDAACLDRLLEKRLHLDTNTGVLGAKRVAFQQKLPRGRAVLQAELDGLDSQCQILLGRCPEIEHWQGDALVIQRLESAFTADTATLEKNRQRNEKEELDASQRLQKGEVTRAGLKEAAIGARAKAQAAREELDRHGEERQLQADLVAATSQVATANAHLATATLTEAEQTVDERQAAAESAMGQRERRCQEAKDQLNRLRGRMEENQGLHTRRTDAATAVCEIERHLDRERLKAGAHLRLRQLFDECKDTQVKTVMGPISTRVLQWAKALGLDDFREVRFGDRFMPEGIVRTRTGSETIHTLDGESYGTEEQLSILVRLALAGVLAHAEPAVCILDDPLAHADPTKHRRMLDILRLASQGNPGIDPPAGPLQMLVLTCHPERFDYLAGARIINLAKQIVRAS